MRRLLTSLAVAVLITSGAAFTARADEAATKDSNVQTAPSDGKAGEMPASCKEGGGCCGAAECKDKAAAEAKAADAGAGDCPCKHKHDKPAS